MLNWQDEKILVTGGGGFLGSWVTRKLGERGVVEKNIFIPRSAEFDLRKRENCEKAVLGKSMVFHVAALSGNEEFHWQHPGSVFYDNLIIGIELMEASRIAGVKKFVSIGTAVAYPEGASLPYKEENLWDGLPAEVHRAYGLAKRMFVAQGTAYAKQYSFNAIHLILPNMFGPGKRKESSYVIPSVIKKVVEAKKTGKNFIDMWGSGTATREFLYIEDAAEGVILAAEKYHKPNPVNLGSGTEISIKDLTRLILDIMRFEGEVRWDTSRPENHARCLLDTARAEKEFGFRAKMDFKEGLKKTVDWYLSII